jgi:hypothetical protein
MSRPWFATVGYCPHHAQTKLSLLDADHSCSRSPSVDFGGPESSRISSGRSLRAWRRSLCGGARRLSHSPADEDPHCRARARRLERRPVNRLHAPDTTSLGALDDASRWQAANASHLFRAVYRLSHLVVGRPLDLLHHQRRHNQVWSDPWFHQLRDPAMLDQRAPDRLDGLDDELALALDGVVRLVCTARGVKPTDAA